MRRTLTLAPGVAGMNKDAPAYLLDRNESRSAKDAVVESVLRQIKGWTRVADLAVAAADLEGVAEAEFITNGNIRRYVAAYSSLYIHPDSGAASSILSGGSSYLLPRCTYRDQQVWCFQDGQQGIVLVSGSNQDPIVASVAGTFTAGEATITGTTFSSAPQKGCYVDLAPDVDNQIELRARVLESSTTALTAEDILAGATVSTFFEPITRPYGMAYPAVEIYDAGSITVSGSVATGYGTGWSALPGIDTVEWAILIKPDGAKAQHGQASADPSSDTSWAVRLADVAAKSHYSVTSRCPAKDAAAHRGSLALTGCDAHRNRVYISPQDWNPALPPGYVPPVDPTDGFTSDNPNDFLLFPIDVPSPYDGDANVALLSMPDGLRVVKGESVHNIAGDYPSFSQGRVVRGVGCMDLRSAKVLSFGGVFADEQGVHLDVGLGEQVRNLAEGRQHRGGIANDWRARCDGFDPSAGDYCAVGEHRGRMEVTLVTGGGADAVTYLYEPLTDGWTSEVTNHTSRFYFESNIDGQDERLLAVGDADQGYVLNFGPALDLTGTAENDDGTAPALEYVSPENLAEAAGIDGEAVLGDVAITANVYDVGAAGATQLDLSVDHGGGLRQGASDSTKTLDPIESDTVDRVDRHERRVNRSGRLFQLTASVSAVGTDDVNTKVELAEVACTFFDTAAGT